jgi:hypothetical protein
MMYHHSPNLREMFAGDLSKKLTNRVKLMDFKVQDCNCKDPRGTGKCQYRGVCRVLIVIYKITCKMTNKIYIRNTQQNFKKRMAGHFQDVKKLMEKGVHSDSYTRHSEHFNCWKSHLPVRIVTVLFSFSLPARMEI